MKWLNLFSVILLLAVKGCSAVTSSCQDIDPKACPNIAIQNPQMCNDPGLSTLVCPRFCKKCPLMCYDCVITDKNNQTCSQVRECAHEEQCMIRHLKSTRDGHSEVVMQCASVQLCDLTTSTGIIGKRDVSIHCCADDLCNSNEITTTTTTTRPTTTTTTTTTTTPRPTTTTTRPTTSTAKPTTLPPGCSNDIIIYIEDNSQRRQDDTLQLIHFLQDTLGKLTIGPDDNEVAMVLFDDEIHVKWNFYSWLAIYKSSLLATIGKLSFRYHTDRIDYGDMAESLIQVSNRSIFHDRRGKHNVAIIFADNDIKSLQFRHKHFALDKIIYVSLTRSSYVGSFHNIAHFRQHMFTVLDYNNLWSIQTQLLIALCDRYRLDDDTD